MNSRSKPLTETYRALRRAARTPRLVLLLWGAHLAIAAVAFYPALRHLNGALAKAPAGDEFLRRFSLPLFGDLMRSGRAWFEGFGQLLTLVVVLTLLWNVLAAGGALESLLSGDPSRMAHRFGRGAGRFFGRFLRMGLAAAPAALLVAGILAGPIFGVRASLDDTAEGAKFWLGLAGLLVALFAILLVQLALDLARIRVARDDVRKGVRVFRDDAARSAAPPLAGARGLDPAGASPSPPSRRSTSPSADSCPRAAAPCSSRSSSPSSSSCSPAPACASPSGPARSPSSTASGPPPRSPSASPPAAGPSSSGRPASELGWKQVGTRRASPASGRRYRWCEPALEDGALVDARPTANHARLEIRRCRRACRPSTSRPASRGTAGVAIELDPRSAGRRRRGSQLSGRCRQLLDSARRKRSDRRRRLEPTGAARRGDSIARRRTQLRRRVLELDSAGTGSLSRSQSTPFDAEDVRHWTAHLGRAALPDAADRRYRSKRRRTSAPEDRSRSWTRSSSGESETVIVTLADGRKFALVPGAEWQSLDETSYLTSTPGNRAALAQGLKEVAEGKTVEVDL